MVDKSLGITREQMLEDLLALIPSDEPEGEGWFTLQELAEASGKKEMSLRQVYFKLWKNEKVVERWEGGKPPKVYYRMKDDHNRQN